MDALNEWVKGIDLTEILDWLMFAAAALIAISVHESSHALSACWLGDDTAKRMGRVSLNPLRHLDVVGFLMMVFAHFGWARPVPVNMYRFKNPKAGMALTAAAGPISNVLLALLFGAFYWAAFGLYLKQVQATGIPEKNGLFYLFRFFEICQILNAGLAVFNLIPISPLDGSKILAVILPNSSYELLMRYERYGMMVLLLLLVLNVLDGPLIFLRDGLLNGIDAVTKPLAVLISGVSF